MEVTGVGLLCFAACLLVIARPVTVGLPIFALFLPLQTAAAINLPSFGGMSILCSYVLIGALIAAIAVRPAMSSGLFTYGVKSRAVLLFSLFTAYAVLSAYFMPRFFAEELNVYSFARVSNDPGGGIPLTVLRPSSGNISQSFYALGNLAVFWIMAYFLSVGDGFRRTTSIINIMTSVHLLFAALSIFQESALARPIFNFIHTSNYAILSHHEIAGIPRLIGSYSEPSALGGISVGLFSFNFVRYMQTRGIWYGLTSLMLLATALGSLATTAFATLGALIALWSIQTLTSLVRRGLKQEDLTLVLINAVFTAIIILFLFFEPARDLFGTVYERLFGEKLTSDSAMERGAWNAQGISNMVDTNGFGVGLGSARTSSVAIALLSNVGVLGFFLFGAFVFTAFLQPASFRRIAKSGDDRVVSIRIFSAARAGAIALLIGQLIAGTSVNGSLFFYLYAAMATAALSERYSIQRERPPPGAVMITRSATRPS